MSKLTFSLFVLLLTLALQGKAQEFNFVSANHRIALPSLECYNLLQDQSGALWIGTENGLVRYDGYSTKVFDQQNGLPEKAIYASANHQGKPLFASAKNRLLSYSQGQNSLKEIPISPTYQARMGEPIPPNVTYALRPSGSDIYLIGGWNLHRTNSPGQKLHHFPPPMDRTVHLLQTKAGLVPLNSGIDKRYGTVSDKMFFLPLQLKIHGPKGSQLFQLPYRRIINGNDWRVLSAETPAYHYISIYNRIIRLDKDLQDIQVTEIAGPIISLYADPQGGLWAGTLKRGLYYLDSRHPERQAIVSLSNLSISGTLQDGEGNLWCSTLENGIYLARNRQLLGYSNVNGQTILPTMLQTLDDKLWISTPGHGLQYLDVPTNRFRAVDLDPKNSYYHIWKTGRDYLLSSDLGLFRYDIQLQKTILQRYQGERRPILYHSIAMPNGDRYAIVFDQVLRIPKGSHRPQSLTRLKGTGRGIGYVSPDSLLYSSTQGLFSYDLQTKKSNRFTALKSSAGKFFRDRDGKLWICTTSDGLFTFQQGKLKPFPLPTSMPPMNFYDIAQAPTGDLYVGTDQGLLLLPHQYQQSQQHNNSTAGPHPLLYSRREGLPTNRIIRLAVAGERIFLCTTVGLYSLPLGLAKSPIATPELHLTNHTHYNAQGKPHTSSPQQTPLSSKTILPYKNNRIDLEFGIGSLADPECRIGYTLGSGEPITYVSGNHLSLQRLSPGDYQFRAFALSGNRIRSVNTVQFDFSVQSPFYQKWWFLASCLILTITIFWHLKNLQLARIQKKSAEQARIQQLLAESKLTALQAQMNPHFIFNAINSIQNYIYQNRQEDAHSYLNKFSKLIRLILEQSAEKFISLERELQALQLYTQLEQLRFRQAFHTHFQLDPKLDLQHTFIPTMLIQPYVENAIWHGLMHLQGSRPGQLHIQLQQQGQQLHIHISDNGIGRKKANQLQGQRLHIPVGMLLTQDRLDILQQLYRELDFKVSIKDLYDPQQEAIGTQVHITLSIPDPELID